MAKLYDENKEPEVVIRDADPSRFNDVDIESGFKAIDDHVEAYDSVSNIYNEVASESLTFVDNKNVVLFNEYLKVISKNLNVTTPVQVDRISLEEYPVQIANYKLSLEGWIGDLWNKIKTMFTKMYDSIKGFFNRWATKAGRIKGKLANIKKVLEETNKNLVMDTGKEPFLPTGLQNKMRGYNVVNLNNLSTSIDLSSQLSNDLIGINKKAESLINKGLVSSDFISKTEELKNEVLKAVEQQEDNNANKDNGLKATLVGTDKNRQIDADNKKLQEGIDSGTQEVQARNDKLADLMDNTKPGEDLAYEDIKAFLLAVVEINKKVINKPLMNGLTITKFEYDEKENRIVSETKDSDIVPEKIELAGREDLLKVVTTITELISNTEEDLKTYGKVNDKINESLKTVDRLITDIDKLNPEQLGKYKNILSTRIRKRLTLAKDLFRDFNREGKLAYDNVFTLGEAVCDYSVACMKFFG